MSKILPLGPDAARALVQGLTTRLASAVERPGVFSAEECDRIIALRDSLGFDDARVEGRDQAAASGARQTAPEIRRTDRTHVLPSPATAWLFDRLGALVVAANAETWQFRLSHMEPLQLLSYPEAGHYDWHADLGATGIMALRKVSVTVQLSDEADYDGGRLELQSGGRVIVPPRPRGSAVLFPAWLPHRVTPVTRGLRHALVLWVVGRRPLR